MAMVCRSWYDASLSESRIWWALKFFEMVPYQYGNAAVSATASFVRFLQRHPHPHFASSVTLDRFPPTT